MMSRPTISVAIVSFAILAGALTRAQVAKPIDYDTFCKLADTEAKRTAFIATTADNRGQLVRTQLERWRDANRASLNAQQSSYLSELIASITSDTYKDGPEGEAARVKAQALSARMRELFTDAQVMAMQPYAPCIAKSK